MDRRKGSRAVGGGNCGDLVAVKVSGEKGKRMEGRRSILGWVGRGGVQLN